LLCNRAHGAVAQSRLFQIAATAAGTVCFDKKNKILSFERAIIAASRHSHHDVSGDYAKELRQGRGGGLF
jgi:hypothetical protein